SGYGVRDPPRPKPAPSLGWRDTATDAPATQSGRPADHRPRTSGPPDGYFVRQLWRPVMPIWDDLTNIEHRTRIADLIARWWRIDILIVADTIVSLGPEHHPDNMNENYFGMAHLLGVLEGMGRVVKAHRQTDPLGAPNVIENFNYAAHDLSQYDQIWLMGYGSGVLRTDQQAAIARFMNAGGGVFATGEHASPGSMLAGALPRVRSLRRWAPPPQIGRASGRARAVR